MLEFYEPGAALVENAVAQNVARLTSTNRSALDFAFGVQRAMLDQMIFAGNDMLDRIQTETHLFNEFSSKMAEAHSVKNLKTMCEECAAHQIAFARRDSERIFKHGERLIEATAGLLQNRPQI
jgi:hypothetical protein